MKIAILSSFYPFRGGISQFNAKLYSEFRKMGHEVTAFTFSRQYPSFLFPGKTQYVTPEDKAMYIDSIAILDSINPFSYWKTARTIQEYAPDLVIMKYWTSYLAPALGMVAHLLKKKGIPTITILDNVIPHEAKFFDKPFSKWFIKQNTACLAMSRAVLNDMLSLCPDKAYTFQSHPLYNHFGKKVLPEEAKRKLGLDLSKKTLLFFGLIRDYKGLDLLIEALHHLDDTYQLVIAGETYGSFDKYAQIINTISRPERIFVFNRYIDDDEVTLFFSAADICVLPYRSATQSGITAICYHFGVPVIATRTGGLAETIEKTGTGIMTDEISPESIANSIKLFYSSDRSIFVNNINKLKKNLTWEKFANAILDLFEKLK